MAKGLNKLSFTLGSMLKARGIESRLSEYRILGQWEKAVGPVIAGHAQPQALRGKKLFLAVDSPAWMQQLSMLKPEIIEKINGRLGKPAINDLSLRLGEITPVPRRREEALVLAPLDAEERAQVERYVADIADPATREAVRRVIEKDFRCKKGREKKRT